MFEKEYGLLEKLYFERVSGTKGELEGCLVIQKELHDLGLESRIEEFEVLVSDIHEVSFEVTSPYQKKYEATAYTNCADFDGELDLEYFESDTMVSRKRVCGKAALLNGYLGMKTYKALNEAKAKAFITYNGNVDVSENDLDPREVRKPLKEFGDLPGVNLGVFDAMELVEKKAEKVHLSVRQTTQTFMSQNLVCDFDYGADDWIICTAHYDSVPHSKGAYDNATGSVCLFGMARQLKDVKLKHNVRLIWCGSEERGLLGSKDYVEKHKEELENVSLVVNVDMIGSTMGKRIAVSTADMAFVNFIDYYAKIEGFPLESSQGVYSSDSTPFADAGIPAVSFARITTSGTGTIHSRYDVMEHLSKRMLMEDTRFITKFVVDMGNAYVIPVEKTMPDNMKEELDKYLGRDLVKKDDKDNK